MKIGIEAQRVFRKHKHGMDMVVLELIRNLQSLDHENEYLVFVKPGEDDQILSESDHVRIVKLRGGFYPFWEQIFLPIAAKKEGCQLLHCTSNTAPVFTSIPLMVTLHDIIYMEKSLGKILGGSGTLYQKFGNMYRKIVVPLIVRKCRKIITVSHFEERRIGSFFGIPRHRLISVYNGVSEYFQPVTDQGELQRVRQKYHLPDHFFFFLGNTDPKKNTKGTLKAFSEFSKRAGVNHKLVMIDYEKEALKKLLSEIGDESLLSNIHLTGYIKNTDLPAVYSQSEAFLYPSLRESFGIPILEAMSCGVPVITSNTSSMPEIAGDAALMVNPFDPQEITSAMIRILTDRELKVACIEKGFLRAKQFSWKRMAGDVLSIYRDLDSEHRV